MKRALPPRAALAPLLLLAALAAVFWLAQELERGVWLSPAPEGASGPFFAPPGGRYERSLRVDIRPLDPAAEVIFTTGGYEPTLTVGTLYEQPLLLDAAFPGVTVVRAREVVGGAAGPVASTSYIVGVESALPVLSLAVEPLDLWDAGRGIAANPWQRGDDWERPVHITYVDGETLVEADAGLRVEGRRRERPDKLSWRLYFRNEYGLARLETPLFASHPYQDVQSYKRLLLQAGDRSGRWTLLEDALVTTVAASLGRTAVQGRPVLLFINGEPWGIYRLSERLDRFFLEDNLGIRSADLIRDGDVEEGDSQSWDALLDWVTSHDLADQASFAAVEAQMDVADFTDYAILQIYFGLPADRFSAARSRQGGGRWFWMYGGQGTRPDWGAGDGALLRGTEDTALLLQRLLENPAYRARFLRRAEELLNTTLSAAAMEAQIERLAAQLRPDIGYEEARWAAPTRWEDNVAALCRWAQQRPQQVREQLVAALGLPGTATLTFDVEPGGAGTVYVYGAAPSALPWQGVFFLGAPVEAVAVPAPGYAFAGWGAAGQATLLTVTVSGPQAFTAHFAPATERAAVQPNDVVIAEYWINDNGTRYASIGNRPIEGDWVELRVMRPGGVDLRGWRLTDNDTRTGTAEGSLILPPLDSLAAVPEGTTVLIVATETSANAAQFGRDDLDARDRRLLFYVGNGNLDVTTDPGFGIGRNNDNLVLLAPGPSADFGDDVGVDFVAEGARVTPFSFGVLADGVVFEAPFAGLGADDGAIWVGEGSNDRGDVGWIVDPPASQSGDEVTAGSVNILTPGSHNPPQRTLLDAWWLLPSLLVTLLLLVLLAPVPSRRQGSRSSRGR